MTFASPLVLVALAVIPALGAWYLGEQRRRVRAAAAFAAPVLTPSVTPNRPGFRRHAPMVILAVALAALIVGAARPQRTAAVPVKSAAFMLASDVSNSMTATDVPPSRLQAAKRAALKFVAGLPSEALVGQMSFARRPVVLQSPTTDHALTRSAIRQLVPGGGGTAIGDTITTAVRALSGLRTAQNARLPSAIVLLSDGASNVGPGPVLAAQQARAAHIPIYTIALGTRRGAITHQSHGHTITSAVPVSTTELGAIATASGGRAYTAADAASANAVYRQLATRLGHKHVKRDLNTLFAGGALVLLVSAAGLSLGWFGRLI
ncbi:MAG: VWA domain-containing protein [Actinomycetota bacterium]|nr:VWA domain-containing protein [Actinomycetota bacterium]